MCLPALGSFKLVVDLRPDEVQPPSWLLCCSLRKDLVCEALALFAVGSQRCTDLQALISESYGTGTFRLSYCVFVHELGLE